MPEKTIDKSEVLPGSLALMVLRILDSLGPQHGWGIARRIEQISEGVLELNQGTLYPALLRMEQLAWISTEWGTSDNNRRAKFYAITKAGRKQLAAEAENWERMALILTRFVKPGEIRMNAFRLLAARLAGLLGKSRAESELDDELQFHFDQEVDHQISRGLTPEQARAVARKKFGGLDKTKESYRDTRGFPLLENFLRDLRYGARMLRRSPAFTAVAVISLGLGIGANSAVFTLTNAALLRGSGAQDPERLARINVTAKGQSGSFSYPVFQEMTGRATSFSDVAASGGIDLTSVIHNGSEIQEGERIQGSIVSANYFRTLGIGAALGRTFAPSDIEDGRDTVAVLRHTFWETSLGADPGVIGRTITLNGTPFTIIGVAEAGFDNEQVGQFRDIWVPITTEPILDPPGHLASRTSSFFRTFGRLKPDVPVTQAAAEVTTIYQQIVTAERAAGTGTRIFRTAPSDWRAEITSGVDAFNPARRRLTKPLTLLSGVVALVLLIACCNVANLLLARGAARQHEIGTRVALGSSRGRLLSQLLTESMLISVLGGLVGFALAHVGARFLGVIAESVLYLKLDLTPDVRVLAFTTAVSLLTTMVFGLIPAIQNSRVSASRAPSMSVRQRTSRLLVVAQVALSVWLMIGAGLLLRSLHNLRAADLGLDRANITTFHFAAQPALQPAEYATLQSEIEQRASALPLARSIAFSNYGLFSKGGLTAPARVPTSNVNPAADREMFMGYVSPGFFDALGMEIVLGRDLKEPDTITPQVGVISESVARHYFGDRNPLGEAIYFPGIDAQRRYIPFSDTLQEARRYEVIGVVRDAFDRGPRNEPAHRIYLPIARNERLADTLYVRASNDAGDVAPSVLALLQEFKGKIRFEEMTTLEQQLNQNYPAEILGARLLTVFGALALLLAAVGLFGVMSYAVARRTSEIGVRMALGAPRGRVLTMVLRETLILVALGIVIGIPVALATTGVLRSMLYGLEPNDAVTIVAAALVLLGIGALAGFVPAHRASRIDPMHALRHE